MIFNGGRVIIRSRGLSSSLYGLIYFSSKSIRVYQSSVSSFWTNGWGGAIGLGTVWINGLVDSGGQAGGGRSSVPCLLFEQVDLIGKDLWMM